MANSFSFSNNLDIVWSGKIPRVMGDIAKGIKSFKAGMKEGEADEIDDTSASEEKKKKPRKKSTKEK